MIQPTLTSYTLDSPPVPVLLDSVSLNPSAILLLDTFFHIVIWAGENIAQWREAGYQEQTGYESFKAMLDAPIEDAKDLLANRSPMPRYAETVQNGSQSRYLLSRLNPSTTHMTDQQYGALQGQAIFTDDVSLQVFMDHLKKLAVASS